MALTYAHIEMSESEWDKWMQSGNGREQSASEYIYLICLNYYHLAVWANFFFFEKCNETSSTLYDI